MRYAVALALLTFSLTACDTFSGGHHKPVDAANLPPLTSREQVLLTAGDAAMRQNQLEAAEKNYLSAIGESKGHVEAHLALAELYTKIGNRDKAREVLEKAAEYQPNHVEVNYRLGKIYLVQNRPADALRVFERGLISQPTNLDLLSGKGVAHDMLRQHLAAQNAYWQAIHANPTSDLTLVKTNLAMSYLFDNKPQKVVELLKQDARKPGASPVTRHNLALAYGLLGRNAEARKLLGKDMTEAERQASLKYMREYIAQPDDGKVAPLPVSPALIKTY